MSLLPPLAFLAALLTSCGPRATTPAPITGAAPATTVPPAADRRADPDKLAFELRDWFAGNGPSLCRAASDPTLHVFVVVDAVTAKVVDRLAELGVEHDPELAGHNWELTGTLDRATLDEIMALPFVTGIGEIGCSHLY